VFQQANLQAAIDALHANVAILRSDGSIRNVNERWRRFGLARDAKSDYVGLNYLTVCANAAARGDEVAQRVEDGIRRLLVGQAESYGTAYRCGDRTFRLSARRIHTPDGGVIIAHQDISAILEARSARRLSHLALMETRDRNKARIDAVHEELGQKLTAISLAAVALENGGNVVDAVTLIKLAVEEARQELKLLRYEGRLERIEIDASDLRTE
jgi:hypothetical protein